MKPWTILDKLLWRLMVPLANLAVRPLAILHITPNQLTLFNFLIFIPLSAFLFSLGTHTSSLFGLISVLVYSYFDHVDGLLARSTGKTSKFGAWFDQRLDIIASSVIISGVIYGIFQHNMDNLWFGIGIAALFSQIGILGIVFEYERNLYHRSEVLDHLTLIKNFNITDKIVIEFIFLRSFIFLFFGTLRYSLFLAVVFNQLKIFILVWAIFNNIRWVVLLWAYASATSGNKYHSESIKLLQKFLHEK
jgi:phosphatidylglycerophosphate synthase